MNEFWILADQDNRVNRVLEICDNIGVVEYAYAYANAMSHLIV